MSKANTPEEEEPTKPVLPTLNDLMARLDALAAQNQELAKKVVDAEKKVEERKTYTEGRQPIDEMRGFLPKREPVVTTLPNGTKRVDF